MSDLTIVRAKVNPAGKDRRGPLTTNRQRNAEWVDIKNTSARALQLNGVVVVHHTFSGMCHPIGTAIAYEFPMHTLQAGEVIRVHSGVSTPVSMMPLEDQSGADWHVFTSKDFVWNNTCGDTVEVWNGQTPRVFIDKATYAPNQSEGRILVRNGDRLI